MIFGSSPSQREARRLQTFHLQVLVQVRLTIRPGDWRHELLSPFWRLYRFSRRGASIVWSGGSMAMRPNRVYLVPAWLGFSTQTTTVMEHDYVHFDVHGLLPGWLKNAFSRPVLLRENSALDATGSAWTSELVRKSPVPLLGFARAAALVHAAFAQAVDELPMPEREMLLTWIGSHQDLQPAIDTIEQRLSTPPGNSELAVLCRMGIRQFIRRFKDATGLTPAQFGLERRLLAAARWLSAEDRTIEDIAEAAGFTDRFYFSKVFKARLGSSPARYRQEHRRERG